MATFNEIYNNYLSGVQGTAPISGQQGITSLATPSNSNGEMGSSPTNAATATSTNTASMGIGSIGLGDIGKAIGFAVNPALGIANMVATNVFGKSPMSMAMDAMGFGDASSTGTANATDTGDMGSEAANDAASASAASGGTGGADSAGDGGDGYARGGRIGYATGGILQLNDPMDQMYERMYVDKYGFNPFPKYGFNSYMDYNTARLTNTPMNENISDLEDYLGTLDTAQKFNVPVNKDLTTEGISNLISKSKGETFNTGLTPTPTSTPDYGQQALSEMLSRYNVGSLGDIKNFNYLIPGYKDKNNLEVKAFETRTPELAVNRRAQQLADIEARTQQAYQTSLQKAPTNIREHINTAVGGLNSSQRQQYINYAVQNPDKAIAAAQQNKDFMAATQRNTTPPAMANGGRVSYLQGGLVSLLGDYYGKR